MNRPHAIVAGIVALMAMGCTARLPKTSGDSLLAVIEEGSGKSPPRSPEEIERAQTALEEIPTRPRSEALAAARQAAMAESDASEIDLDEPRREDEGAGDDEAFDLTQNRVQRESPMRFVGHSKESRPRNERAPEPARKNRREESFDDEPDLRELMARAIERGNKAIRQDSDSGAGRPQLVRQISWPADVDPITIPLTSSQQPEHDSQPSRRRQSSASSERKADVALTFAEDDPPPSVASASENTLRKSDPVGKGDTAKKTGEKAAKKRDAVETAKASTDWPAAHREAINALKEKISQARSDGEDRNEIARLETMLRLQYLLAGDRDEATRPIDNLPAAEQEYWKHQMFELADMLSDKQVGDARRYSLALHALDEATARLAELSSLSLRSAAFCKSVRDFGSIERFERLDFTRNQEVLLYVEVRNFTSQKVSDATFETELQGSYRVVDRSGASKAERVLPLDKQTCANRRRDYYIAYRLFIPAELEPGAYTLELTIEDKKAGKSTNARVDFNVVSSPTE